MNSLIDIAQEWHLLDLEKDNIHYDTKLGNIKMKRALLVESANQLVQEVENLISATDFSELAKSLYSVYEYENAEKYHMIAVEKGQGALGIACNRSYRFFFFVLGKSNKVEFSMNNQWSMKFPTVTKSKMPEL